MFCGSLPGPPAGHPWYGWHLIKDGRGGIKVSSFFLFSFFCKHDEALRHRGSVEAYLIGQSHNMFLLNVFRGVYLLSLVP